MKTYKVRIKATVTKDVMVSAEDKEEATVAAHEAFSVLSDGGDEDYTEDTISVIEVTQ